MKQKRPKNPSELDIPVLLMNFPLTIDNKIPNNVYMDETEIYDLGKAFSQWLTLYKRLSQEALVYVLPSYSPTNKRDLQDLTFVSNLGCYLPHIKNENIIVLSNFNSFPRRGEDLIGGPFFESLNYKVIQPETFFEGEADCKHVRDNLYISAIGRTSSASHEWLKNEFSMDIVSIKTIPELYHLDCILLPINKNDVLVVTSVLDKEDIKKLEDVVNIISIPKQYSYESWTNAVIIGNTLFFAAKHEYAIRRFEKIMYKYDLELENFDLSEFDKSGADLSCFVMILNRGKTNWQQM